MANTIGTAYIQIEPTTKGISGSISSALDSDAEVAGKSAGGKLASALGSAAKIGVSAIAGATAAVGAFGAASVQAGTSFDSSMSQVAATMEFSKAELEDSSSVAAKSFQKLRDFAQEMGSTTAFSASESADALNYMALAGYDAETSMKMLPNVLNLAAAGGIDLASASDMVTDAQSALGLSLGETSSMVDQMATASSKSNTSVAQLGEAFLTIGATAKNLSGGTVELSTALGILADNGIKGSEGGTHLRNIMMALTPTTEAAAKAWEVLGVDAYDANGELRPLEDTFGDLSKALDGMSDEERTRTIGNMFNKTDIASVNALLNTSSERWTELGGAINKAAFDNELFSKTLGESGIYADTMKMQFELLGVSADDYDKALINANGSAEDFFQALADGSNGALTYNDVVGILGDSVNEIQLAFDSCSSSAQNMADVQLDNLNGDVTLFKSALEGAQIAVSDGLTPTLRDFVRIGSQGLSDITEGLKEGGVDGAMQALGSTISSLVDKVIELLPDMVDAGMHLLESVGQGIIDNLPKLLEAALKIILEIATGLGESLPELIPSIVDVVLQITESLIDNVDLLIDGAIALIMGLAEGLINALPRLIEKGPEIVLKLVDAIIRNAPKLVEAAIQLILKLQKGLIDNLPQLVAAVPRLITGLVNKFTSLASSLIQIGKDIVNGIKNGIRQAWEGLLSWLSSLCSGLVDRVKNALKIGSPSKVFRDEVGQWIPEGMAVGITANADSVTDSIDSLNEKTMSAAKDLTLDYSSVNAVSDNNKNTNDSIIPAIENALISAMSSIGIYMDSTKVGNMVAAAVDNQLGRLSTRRV